MALQAQSQSQPISIATFYKFVTLSDLESLRKRIKDYGENLDLRGTILLGEEGVNATISGSQDAIERMVEFLLSLSEFEGMEFKYSYYDEHPFKRWLVKIKKEIVAMRVGEVDPHSEGAKYVDAKDLLKWIQNNEVVLVDTRNTYETVLGSFRDAVLPEIRTFRQFPDWVEENWKEEWREKKVVTFCTGGIRCEKATTILTRKGYDNVYQLKGGILKYFEETLNAEDNGWDGDCFVFDNRLAVDKKLQKSPHHVCKQCLQQLTPEDVKHPDYVPGGECPKCLDENARNHQKRVERGERITKMKWLEKCQRTEKWRREKESQQ